VPRPSPTYYRASLFCLCRVRRLVILFYFFLGRERLSAAVGIYRLPPVSRGLTTSFRTSLSSRIRSPSSQPCRSHRSCEVKVRKKDLIETTGHENHLLQPLSCLGSVDGVLPLVFLLARISPSNVPRCRLFVFCTSISMMLATLSAGGKRYCGAFFKSTGSM
jgi:hypothetical protein